MRADGQRLDATARHDDAITNSAQRQRLRDRRVGFLVHPLRSRGLGPRDEMVVRSQSADRDKSRSRDWCNRAQTSVLALAQQGDHQKGTVIPVRHDDITFRKRIQQAAQEGRFSRLLAGVWTDSQIEQAPVASDRIAPTRAIGRPTPRFCPFC